MHKRRCDISTYSQASEALPWRQRWSGRMLNTLSATTNLSRRQSLKSTGPIQESMGTSKTSTAKTSEPLTFSPEAFRASPSVVRASAQVRRMTAISGLKCYESYEQPSPGGLSVKTLVACLLGTEAWYSTKCVLTWKRKVTKSGLSLYQLAVSTHRTGEIGSGLLPTPRVSDTEGAPVRNAEFRNGTWSRLNRKGVRFGIKTKDALASIGLTLQPAFALWMMGYPADWLDLVDGEMPRSKAREML